jgi:hypothetical protein
MAYVTMLTFVPNNVKPAGEFLQNTAFWSRLDDVHFISRQSVVLELAAMWNTGWEPYWRHGL